MKEVEIHKLQVEAQKGEAAKMAWDHHVLPFFTEKESELFDAFKDASTVNREDIVLIKMQANVLSMIKDYFESKINTGILANNQLQLFADKE